MANKRLVSVIVAAGVITAGVSITTAWAGGPGGAVEDTDISEAVGTGVFDDELVGFLASAPTNDQAAASVIAACQAAGGSECTADEVTNENLCIASVADDDTDVVAGGAGVTVEAARIDAIAKAAANGTPIAADSPIVISDCP
ncbi:MAG: DUF4189 domain-containing protein [Mycobacterium sp.]